MLASASPRRRALLQMLGLAPSIRPAEVDEQPLAGEEAARWASRVASRKNEAVAPLFPGAVVLSADTVVALGPRLFGKPADPAEALLMLRELSGREHEVVTAVCASGPRGRHEAQVRTRVRFRALAEDEARWYVATGEPLDKAGAYGIQERGGMFVASIEGSHSNVVGLPLAETVELLERAGLELPWRREGR